MHQTIIMKGKVSVPEKMQALFLETAQGPLAVRLTDVPVPGPGEVLIKMLAAPVNPSDLARLKNPGGELDLKSYIPGLEGSGTVVAAGKGLMAHLWLGKRVACSSEYPSGGTWAQYMVTRAGLCFPLGRKVSDEQGSMSLVNPLTALAFFEIVRKGRHKAIINNPAASALGRMVELLGDKKGIPVINVVRNQKQADILKGLHSRFILNSSDHSFIADLATLAKALEATILFDSVCNNQLPEMIGSLPSDSSVIIYGNLTGEEYLLTGIRQVISKHITISGFYLGNHARRNGLLKNMIEIMKVSRLLSTDMKIHIRDTFPLSRAQEAVDSYLENMSAGKVLLIPE